MSIGTKYVCAECFNKQEAKDIIERCGEIGKCDYCGQDNVKVMKVEDFLDELYKEHSLEEDNTKQKYIKKGILIADLERHLTNKRMWGEVLELDSFDNMEEYLKSLTDKPILQNDLINCWNKE